MGWIYRQLKLQLSKTFPVAEHLVGWKSRVLFPIP